MSLAHTPLPNFYLSVWRFPGRCEWPRPCAMSTVPPHGRDLAHRVHHAWNDCSGLTLVAAIHRISTQCLQCMALRREKRPTLLVVIRSLTVLGHHGDAGRGTGFIRPFAAHGGVADKPALLTTTNTCRPGCCSSPLACWFSAPEICESLSSR